MVDVHSESFVWTRVFGYDLRSRHGRGVLGARLYSQADLPRMREGGLTGAVLSIATNPFRPRAGRAAVLAANVERLGAMAGCLVSTGSEWRAARAAGEFPCFVAVQGGNAVSDAGELPDVVSRVTVVHLTRSVYGSPSAPLGGDRGLTAAGRSFVDGLCGRRVLVDLAHASPRMFGDALAVVDGSPGLPPVVTHTGVSGVHRCWRNVDDDQVRAIADRGGVVGVMYHRGFLGGPRAEAVVRHLEHIVHVAGEDTPCLGSDWDGFIVTPSDMATADQLPVLVQVMLDRGWPERRMTKVLGANYLRVVEAVRP